MIVETNVLLLQTLYFENQLETEALIVELLMGLITSQDLVEKLTKNHFDALHTVDHLMVIYYQG